MMKKLMILISFILFAVLVNAQSAKVFSLTVDTVKSNETIYFTLPAITTNYDVLTIQALCTQVGGTSDGTIVVEGSLDGTSYKSLVNYDNFFHGFNNDTLTITDGAVGMWVLQSDAFKFVRLKVAGTSSDTTKITPKYWYK